MESRPVFEPPCIFSTPQRGQCARQLSQPPRTEILQRSFTKQKDIQMHIELLPAAMYNVPLHFHQTTRRHIYNV
jgi:hypothetical protein